MHGAGVVQLASGRYATYWNANLFNFVLAKKYSEYFVTPISTNVNYLMHFIRWSAPSAKQLLGMV